MSTEYAPLDILETLQTHLPIPAQDGPGYCRGCDWESRQIGISSHLQHRAHVAEVIEAQIDAHDRAVKSEVWDQAVAWHAEHVQQIKAWRATGGHYTPDHEDDYNPCRAEEMEKETTDD